MIKDNIILICAFLIVTQLVLISSDDIDWTTPHDELKKLAAPIRKKCLNEIGITTEMVDGVESGNFPDDNKLACYFKCVMEKGGVMKKDGKINTKILMKMIPSAYKKIGNDMVTECRDTSGNDKCDLAYNFNKCMYRANPVTIIDRVYMTQNNSDQYDIHVYGNTTRKSILRYLNIDDEYSIAESFDCYSRIHILYHDKINYVTIIHLLFSSFLRQFAR